MGKKVAGQIVEMLIENGVKRIYPVAGDSLNELNDAVRHNGKIKWIHVRHEEAGAYAAAAEAELDGIGCCAGSSGPGHVHLVNGLYDALVHNGPVIVDIKTNPHALAMPPKIEWEQIKGFTLSVGKMMLGGRMDEAMQTLKLNYKHLTEII